MSKEGYNQLLEFDEDANNIYNNQQMNNFVYSQQQINPNNTGSNFNGSKNKGKTQNIIDNDLNNVLLSSGYKTNYMQNYNNRPKTSIKWRNVMKIDIDSIRNTNNLSLLSSYLDNFIYSNITEDDIQAVPEGNIVKLIKILQFSNEYLLGVRQNLDENIMNLKDQKQGLINEYQKLGDNLINQKDYLDKANQERKMRIKEIADYKNIVSALLQGGIPMGLGANTNTKITDINIDINKYKYNQSRLKRPTNGYKCKYCTGKFFPSEFELKKHLTDIHLINKFSDDENEYIQNIPQPQQAPQEINITMPPLVNPNVNNNQNRNREEFERKLNEMKNEFQEYVHRAEVDNLKSQLLRNKNRNNEGDETKQQLEKMGKTFNDTLKQIMGMMAKNNNQEKQVIIQKPSRNYDNDIRNDEDIRSLKNEIDNTKKLLEIKQKEYDEIIINLENETMRIKNEINQKKEIVPKRTILVTEQKEPISFIKKNVKKLGKPTRFHSGILESDHDDSDNEKKKNEKILNKLKEDTRFFDLILKKKTSIINKLDVIDQPIQENIENKLREIKLDQGDIIGENDLDDFYRRYINRDTKYLNISTFPKYLTPVLPNRFSNNNDVKKNAVFNLNNNLTRTANLFYNENKIKITPKHQVKELIKEDRKDLLDLISHTFHGMDLVNDNNGMIDPYYTSVKELLDFDDIKRTCKILNNVNQEEVLKSQKLRGVNKKVHFVKEKDNKKIIDINESINLKKSQKDEDEFPDVNYFSGGNALAGLNKNNKDQKSQYSESYLFGQNNLFDSSNKLRNTNNFNQYNTNNRPTQIYNDARDSKYTSSIEGVNNINNNINNKINYVNENVPDTKYTSSKEGMNNMTNQMNDKHLDTKYTSSKEGMNNMTNQINDKHLDTKYTSSKEGMNNMTNQINDKHLDTKYTSSKEGMNNMTDQVNDKHLDTKYTSSKEGMNNMTNQVNDKHLDTKYTSSKEGMNNMTNQINDKHLDTKYTSSKEGQNNTNTLQNQYNFNNSNKFNNEQDSNYCSATHGQNNQIINNKSNDSWDNPMVESKASIGSTNFNQNNVQVQNIDSKIVQPQQ